MGRYRIWKAASRVGGLVLFLAIITRIDVRKAAADFLAVPARTWLLVSALILLIQILKSFRWGFVCAAQNIRLSLRETILINFSSTFLGVVTIGRVGELIKIAYLMERGYGFLESFVNVIYDRCLDIALLALSLIVTVYALRNAFSPALLWAIVLSGAGSAAFIALLALRPFRERLVRVLALMPFALRFVGRMRGGVEGFLVKQRDYRAAFVGGAALLSMVSWLIYLVMFILLAGKLNINLSAYYLAACIIGACFVILIPVSVSGLGTRDAALIFLLGHAGIDREKAIAFSFTFVVVNAMAGLYGVVGWIMLPPWAKKRGMLLKEKEP